MNKRKEIANKALMQSVARGFRQGDLRPLFDALDEAVNWKSNAPSQFFRFGGIHNARIGVLELSALVFATYHIRHLDVMEIIAEGDTVWGLFDVESVHQPSGVLTKAEVAVRWVIRNGKIVEHNSFFDTAAVLMQIGALTAH
ncbi:MAG TPA: hypothetical protein VNH44_00985 [Micropepsaceae bacterium]|nr:hypothetical protein [Micropepsaceae bacterium]